MKCYVCDNETWTIDPKVILCAVCKELNHSDLFSKLLTVLIDLHTANKGFDIIKEKCEQFNAIIKRYPLFITPCCKFDVDEHDTDRNALHFLRNYVISEDNHVLQNYHPVQMPVPDHSSLYKTLALLCHLDMEHGAIELRLRNVIDMIINVQSYQAVDPELHSCLRWGETWRYFVLDQLYEKKSVRRNDLGVQRQRHISFFRSSSFRMPFWHSVWPVFRISWTWEFVRFILKCPVAAMICVNGSIISLLRWTSSRVKRQCPLSPSFGQTPNMFLCIRRAPCGCQIPSYRCSRSLKYVYTRSIILVLICSCNFVPE